MEEFFKREEAYQGFLMLRDKINRGQDEFQSKKDNFEFLFAAAVQLAGEGDVLMQDVVAYYYKDGVNGYLDEDYQKYMNWEILSAAGGNEFAIEKLQFFMGYAYDQVVDHPDFPSIKYKNNIDEYNYIYVIGRKICKKLVEKFGLDPRELATQENTFNPFKAEHFRDYRKGVDAVLPEVIQELK